MKRMQRKNFDDIYDEMQNLFSEFQSMGKDVTSMARGVPVDVHEEGNKLVLEADLPGVQKEDINLRADEEKVEISAESKQEVTEENEKYYKQERRKRSFRRTVKWPEKVDADTIEATYEEGVLRVEAEREQMEGRDINVE